MSIRTQNLSNLFKDVKTRTIILFTGALLLIGIVIGFMGISRSERVVTGATITTAAPKGIKKIPLSATATERYAELQRKANIAAAQQAALTGKSAVPTLVGRLEGRDASQAALFGSGTSADADAAAKAAAAAAAKSALTKEQQAELQMRLKQQQAELARQAQALRQQEAQQFKQEQQQTSQAMKRVAQTLFKTWSASPKQVM